MKRPIALLTLTLLLLAQIAISQVMDPLKVFLENEPLSGNYPDRTVLMNYDDYLTLSRQYTSVEGLKQTADSLNQHLSDLKLDYYQLRDKQERLEESYDYSVIRRDSLFTELVQTSREMQDVTEESLAMLQRAQKYKTQRNIMAGSTGALLLIVLFMVSR